MWWWWKEVAMLCSFAVSYTSRRIRCWGGDGREDRLLDYVLENAKEGDPQSVLQAMDDFANAGTWFMSIGPVKGRILDSALAPQNPLLLLELGTYCAYSAIRIASSLSNPNAKLITLETNPHFAEIAHRIIHHAGMSSRIVLIRGSLQSEVERLRSEMQQLCLKHLDFVFMDHHKDCYLPDYLLLKNSKLLGEGSVIFADNMGFPGSPDYWDYLHRHDTELQTVYHKTTLEYLSWISDTIAVSTFSVSRPDSSFPSCLTFSWNVLGA